MSLLPDDPKERKNLPIATGVLDYFPDALAEVGRVSKIGNDQHNPGQPLHWDRSKSTDEADAAIRHFIDRDKKDKDGSYHAAKAAWRMLAYLQKLIESEREKENQKVIQQILLKALPENDPKPLAYINGSTIRNGVWTNREACKHFKLHDEGDKSTVKLVCVDCRKIMHTYDRGDIY